MKTIFWNVDTQYDFRRDDESFKGALAIPKARTIEKNLESLTSFAKDLNIKVINTADWHTEDSKEFSQAPDYKTTFPPHCLMNTKGAEFIPTTNPEDPYIIDWQQPSFDEKEVLKRRNIVLYKDAFDIFKGSTHTKKILDILKPKRVVVYGVATNVCVNFAVEGLLKEGVKVYVPTNAIKEIPGLPLEELLSSWKKNGANLMHTSDVFEIILKDLAFKYKVNFYPYIG